MESGLKKGRMVILDRQILEDLSGKIQREFES